MLKKEMKYRIIFWLSLIVLSPSAFGVALGPAIVKSKMGQPFEAEISIIAAKDEVRNVVVRLAPGNQYTKLGIDYKYFLRHILGKTVYNNKTKTAYFRLFSRTPMFEPQIQVLLEAVWPNGRSYRSYVFLVEPSEDLDNLVHAVNRPQSSRQTLPGEVKIIREDEFIPLQIIPQEKFLSPVSKTPSKVHHDSQYQVKRGDTLSKIARRFYRGTASLEQVMISIQQANPGKFIRNNINLIPAGVSLNIPAAQEIERYPRAQASIKVRQQNQAWRNYVRRNQKIHKKTSVAYSKQESKIDKVLLSTGSSEELISKRKELEDINARLEKLKKIVSQQRQLIQDIKAQKNP